MMRVGVSCPSGCFDKPLSHPIAIDLQGDIIGDGTLYDVLRTGDGLLIPRVIGVAEQVRVCTKQEKSALDTLDRKSVV